MTSSSRFYIDTSALYAVTRVTAGSQHAEDEQRAKRVRAFSTRANEQR